MASNDSNPVADAMQLASSNKPIKTSALQALQDRDERRHSREDALDRRQFEQLLDATYLMKDGQALEGRTALYLPGKCTPRGGEIAHLSPDWIDWSSNIIQIPKHDPCNKRTNDGEICGYCRRRAPDEIQTNNLSVEEAATTIRYEFDKERLRQLGEDSIHQAAQHLREKVNISYEEAASRRWKSKTSQSAREILFDFDVRIGLTLKSSLDEFNG